MPIQFRPRDIGLTLELELAVTFSIFDVQKRFLSFHYYDYFKAVLLVEGLIFEGELAVLLPVDLEVELVNVDDVAGEVLGLQDYLTHLRKWKRYSKD